MYKNKGITMVSLVITIILLIILAGISIQALTNTGLFEAAGQAKKEAKRAQVVEWLDLKLIEEQTYNPTGTAESIINGTKARIEKNKSELEAIGKTVNIEEPKTEEDGEQVDIYFYIQVDKDVFKVEVKGAQFIGEEGKFPPIIKLDSITDTTNSITVQVSTKRNEGGKIEFYIKKEEEKYELRYTATEEEAKGLTYTFSDLEQNKKYSIKIVAVAENKLTAEVSAEKELGKVEDLTDSDIDFTYSPNTWTNGSVKVTAAFKEGKKSDYTLKITDDDPTKADKTTVLGWTNASTGITVSTNKTIYAVLIDNEGQIGAAVSGNVDKIDTVAPTISTALSSTSKGIDSVTLSVGITDTKSGLGKIEWYYGTTNNPTILAGTTKVTDLNGSTAGPTTAQTKTATVTGLSAGTTYFFKVIAYDVAGKTVTSSVINVTTNNPTAADVSYTPIDTSWGVDNVKSALDSLYSR